jgi:hypothetical protein
MRSDHDVATTTEAAGQTNPRRPRGEPGPPEQRPWPGRRQTSFERIWARLEENGLRAEAHREEEHKRASA